MGNMGCNDWSIPYTAEGWAFVEKAFRYGVENKLWDNGSPPRTDLSTINWYNFCIPSYLAHAIKNGKIAILEQRNEYVPRVQCINHKWEYHPDPSGNNDSYYQCSKCGIEQE